MPQPRKTRVRFEMQARYLTFSCNQRLPLFRNDKIKDAFVTRIGLVKATHPFWLLAWVIMPTHAHLLLVPDYRRVTVPAILSALKRPFAAMVLSRWRELGAPILNQLEDSSGQQQFWQQGGGYDRNEFLGGELMEKVWYIHRNPVAAGLVQRPEDWKWSSCGAYLKGEYDGPPIDQISSVGRMEPLSE